MPDGTTDRMGMLHGQQGKDDLGAELSRTLPHHELVAKGLGLRIYRQR